MTLFRKNKTIIFIEPLENEPHEHFIDRGNFIASQPINGDFSNITTYSYMYRNNKYLGCTYDVVVMDKLREMIGNTMTG
jgi:hypothetical protein